MSARATAIAVVTLCAAFMSMACPVWAGEYLSIKDSGSYYPPIWRGWYAGGSVGYGVRDHGPGLLDQGTLGDLDADDDDRDGVAGVRDTDDPGDADDLRLRDTVIAALPSEDAGALGSLHLGYNWQMDRFVYGIEGDISGGSSVNYLGTLRVRGGLAMEGYHIYGTAGVAVLGENRGGRLDHLRVFADVEDPAVGYMIGGGVETHISPLAMIGLEGLYSHFDKDMRVADRIVDDDVDIFTVRLRASIRFHDHRLPSLK